MGRSMSIRCFVPDVRASARDDVVTLSADESHHVSRVLRAGVDDGVIVFDGAGMEWAGTIVESARGRVHVRLDAPRIPVAEPPRSEEHTSELQSQSNLVCRLLLEKKK